MKRLQGKDAEGIRFVAKAVSKDTTCRRNLTALYYDKDWGLMLGTDGHRLHGYQPAGEFETGYYEVLVNKKKEFVIAKSDDQERKFPDWAACFPHIKGEPIYAHADRGGAIFGSYTAIVRNMDSSVTVNYAYLENVLDDETAGFDCWVGDSRNALVFSNHTKFALVMPVRM